MKVFICYRREDSQHQAGRLYDKLELEYGAKSVFKDVDSVPVGFDFRVVLRSAIDRCDAVLVLIGDRWLDLSDDEGKRRIEDPNDFVRIEIEWALKRNIPVVPILVGSKSMPTKDDLPKSIQSFAFRHGVTLRPDPFFRGDVGLLINQLNTVLKQQARRRELTKAKGLSGDSQPSSTQTGAPSLTPTIEKPQATKEQPIINAEIANKPKIANKPSVAPLAQNRNVPQPFAAVDTHATDAPVPYNSQLYYCSWFMLIIAMLGIAYTIFVTYPEFKMDPESKTAEPGSFRTLWMVLVCVTPICLSLVAIGGAISSLRKRLYGLAVIGAYAVMIPCFSPLFGIGIPLGIWAVVMLQHPQVRASFR